MSLVLDFFLCRSRTIRTGWFVEFNLLFVFRAYFSFLLQELVDEVSVLSRLGVLVGFIRTVDREVDTIALNRQCPHRARRVQTRMSWGKVRTLTFS